MLRIFIPALAAIPLGVIGGWTFPAVMPAEAGEPTTTVMLPSRSELDWPMQPTSTDEVSSSPSAVVPTASPRPYVADPPATAMAPRTKLSPIIVPHDKRRSRMARRDIDEDDDERAD